VHWGAHSWRFFFCDILGLSWLAYPASKEKGEKKLGWEKEKRWVIIFFFMGKELFLKWSSSF
jgi:hypothetical protein